MPLVCFLLVVSSACATRDQTSPPAEVVADTSLSVSKGNEALGQRYSFSKPDAVFKLPKALEEISGLTVLDDRHLGAIQDEDGKLYGIEFSTGKVTGDHNFKEDNDYEGVEKVGDVVWVLRSNGTLYKLADWREPKSDAKKYATPLKSSCDAEGLGYDAANDRLLIACKEFAGEGLNGMRAIYAFDLENKVLLEDPVYLIDATRFRQDSELERGLRSIVDQVMDLDGFKPSGIAIHPQTGHCYVISSVQKVVVVLNADGTIIHAWGLPPSLFSQPEGITFLPNGDLFISNEGRGGTPTLLRFNQKSSL